MSQIIEPSTTVEKLQAFFTLPWPEGQTTSGTLSNEFHVTASRARALNTITQEIPEKSGFKQIFTPEHYATIR